VVEEWRPVPGFPNYEVSSEGRVRSLDHVVWGGPRAGFYTKKGRMLRPGAASHNYPTVVLGRGNTRTVHSLVAEAFIGPYPPGQEVRHKDGDRSNPRLENLEYGTRADNVRDAIRHGTHVGMQPGMGERIKAARLAQDPDSYRKGALKGRETERTRDGPGARKRIAAKTVATKDALYGHGWGSLGFSGIAYSQNDAK
jgi:hypothetical protein